MEFERFAVFIRACDNSGRRRRGRGKMKRQLAFAVCITLAALNPAAAQNQPREKTAAPDTAYLQKIWDGWSTLDPANVAQFYASGPHTFFDIAPLKYSSWDEYEKGVRGVLADCRSAKFTVNHDSALHPAGNLVWGTATVPYEMTHKNGKVQTGDMRWTVVFERHGGSWLIAHEHVSMPIG
jgi:ketosteroid isomerase-like protein